MPPVGRIRLRFAALLFALHQFACIAAPSHTMTSGAHASGTRNVTLYVTGQWEGNFLPQPGMNSTDEYGGLARLATVLRNRTSVALAETGNNDTVTLCVDTGAVFGTNALSQYADKQPFYSMLGDFGISLFGIIATDTFAGLDPFLMVLDALHSPIVLSNAVFNPSTTDADRLRRVVRPFRIITTNNFTIGMLGFADGEFCSRTTACGTGRNEFASVPEPDAALIANVIDTMLRTAPIRPQLIVALLAGTAAFTDSPLSTLLIRAGVDVLLNLDGAYRTVAEATDPTFDPPAAIKVVDTLSGRRGVYAAGRADGRAVAKVDLEVNYNGNVTAVTLKPTTRLVQLRKCPNNTPAPDCVVSADDVAAFVTQTTANVLHVLETTIVGKLLAPIDGGTLQCRFAECAIGDLAADSMRLVFPECDVALINGGALRAGLSAGSVTLAGLRTAVPFGNTVSTFRLRGDDLRDVLRHGLSRVDNITTIPANLPFDGTGRYLQVSGLRVRYNPMLSLDKRLLSVEYDRGDGDFKDVGSFDWITCCAPFYIVKGGDGYNLTNARSRVDHLDTQESVIRAYLAQYALAGLNYTTTGKRIFVDNTTASYTCSPPCVHGVCTSSFVCNCTAEWQGADCSVSTLLPVDVCAVREALGVTLFWSHDAATNFPGGVAAVVVFAVLFGIEVLAVPFLTRRYAAVVRATTKRARNSAAIQTARRNMQNLIRLALLCLQAVQLQGIVLNVDLGHDSGVMTLAGDAFGNVGATYFSGTYVWYFWVVMSVTLLWVLYAVAYIADGGALVRRHVLGRVFLFPADQLLQTWVSAGFIPTLLQGMRAFHCWYIGTDAYMVVDSVCNVRCWQGEHWKYVVVGATTILVYYPLSSVSAMLWQDLNDRLDVRHVPHFFVVDPVVKSALVCLRVFFPHKAAGYLIAMAVICAVVSVYHFRRAPCYVQWVNVPVAITYVSASLTALFLFSGVVADDTTVFYGVLAVWFACAVAIVAYLSHYSAPLFLQRRTGSVDRARDMLMSLKKIFDSTSQIASSSWRLSRTSKVGPATEGTAGDADAILLVVLEAVAREELSADVVPRVRAALALGHRWPILLYHAAEGSTAFVSVLNELFMDPSTLAVEASARGVSTTASLHEVPIDQQIDVAVEGGEETAAADEAVAN